MGCLTLPTHMEDNDIAQAGRVSEREWESMTWPERLALFRDIRRLHSHVEAAARLGVSKSSMTKWLCGRRKPSGKHAAAIRRVCVMGTGTDDVTSMLASIHTSSVDNVVCTLDNKAANGTVQAQVTMAAIVCVKIMHILKDVLGLPVVLTLSANYSSNPVSACIKMETPLDIMFHGLCVVEHNTDAFGSHNMLLKVQLRRSGRGVDQAYAYVLNDKAVAVAVDRIRKYFKLNYKDNTPHE